MKKITICKSFDDSEKSQIEHWRSLAPEERFDEFYAWISRF
jgi:hypothetical protein